MALPPIKIVIAGIDEFSKVITKSMREVKKMGKDIRDIGKNMTLGLTIPIGAFGAMTLKTAADFESSMNRVQNITGAVTENFKALQKQARELGATTAFSASEAASAMGFLGMAGFDTEQIMSAMPATLNLAAASGMELGQTADILSDIITGYGKTAKDATDISNIMTKATQKSNTNFEQLGDAMKFAGPVAKGLGINIKETTAVLGLFSNAGFKGAMAGTNFRGAMTALLKPTKEAAETLEKLKIPRAEIIDSSGKITSLKKVIEVFQKSGATTADMLTIFNQRVGPAMSAVVRQGTGELQKLMAHLKAAGGAAKAAADVQMKGLNGQLKALRSAFEELQIAIAESGLLDFATKMVKKLADFVRNLAKLNPKFLKWASIIASVVAAIGPLLVVLGTLMIFVSKVSIAISSAGGIIALLSNPIGWAVAGIIALTAAISFLVVKFRGPLIDAFKRFLPFLKLFIFIMKQFFRLLGVMFGPLFRQIGKELKILGDLFVKTFGMIFTLVEKLTRLVLPKWLERKIGLTPAEEPRAAGTAEDLQNRINKMQLTNKSEATLRFDNAPPGLRVQSATPGINIETNTGMLMPEAG